MNTPHLQTSTERHARNYALISLITNILVVIAALIFVPIGFGFSCRILFELLKYGFNAL